MQIIQFSANVSTNADTNKQWLPTLQIDRTFFGANRKMNDEMPAVQPALQYAAAIVAAFVSKNHIAVSEMPALLKSVHTALTGVSSPAPADAASFRPAVSIKKSVMPDYIVCLEDGKRLTMLKRYLRSRYKLSPDEYRAKWKLPSNYPMVAPNYAAGRSQIAKKIGLGKSSRKKSAKRQRA